jgi:hypothetical protein
VTVLFEGAARALLITHAVLGFTAVLASTHHATHAVLATMGRPQVRPLQRFAWIAPLAVIAQAISGLAIYPVYRVRVRAAVLEKTAPMVVQWFDFKEHLSALALALVIAAALAGRGMDPDTPRDQRWPVAALSGTGAAFLWAATLIGLYVTSHKPLP